MTDTHQTHRVRQILMNELGLTRETVRSEMEAIMSKEIDKHVRVLVNNGTIERYVHTVMNNLAKENRWDQQSFRSIVIAEAKEQVAEFITNNLTIGTK
jgi:hypothetical protein